MCHARRYFCNRLMDRTSYILPYSERQRLHNQAYDAQQRNHFEVCGVLIIGFNKRVALWFLKNRSRQPYRYKLNITDIITVQHRIAVYDQHILGTFHSHPVSEAIPGHGDLENGFFNGVEMIYDVCACEARLWCVKKYQGVLITKELPLCLESR